MLRSEMELCGCGAAGPSCRPRNTSKPWAFSSPDSLTIAWRATVSWRMVANGSAHSAPIRAASPSPCWVRCIGFTVPSGKIASTRVSAEPIHTLAVSQIPPSRVKSAGVTSFVSGRSCTESGGTELRCAAGVRTQLMTSSNQLRKSGVLTLSH